MSSQWLEQFNAARAARQENQARSFEILGETLTVKASIAPQVAGAFSTAMSEYLAIHQSRTEAEQSGATVPAIPDHLSDLVLLDLIDHTVRGCIENGSHAAWERLRAADHPAPLNWEELFSLCTELIQMASGHPTDAPGGSSNGRKHTKRSSAAASSSPATTPTS